MWIYVLVCTNCGEEFKYKIGEIGRCPYCGGELAVGTKDVKDDNKEKQL